MAQHRRSYTEKFKAGSVGRNFEPGAMQGSVAKELGITGAELKTWRLEIDTFGSAEPKRRQKADAAELDRPKTYPLTQRAKGGGIPRFRWPNVVGMGGRMFRNTHNYRSVSIFRLVQVTWSSVVCNLKL